MARIVSPDPPVRSVSGDERRARLARNQLLCGRAVPDAPAVTRSLVALHSTDPASVHLAATARGCPATGEQSTETALYDARTLVRMLGMRRTMFVVNVDFAAVVHAATTRSIAARERSRLVGFIEQGGLARDGAEFLTRLEDATTAALAERGEAYGNELGEAVPGLRRQIEIAGGTQSLTTRVLFVLAAEGRIVRGRPRGSWLSSQYSWSPAPVPPPAPEQLPTADAQAELARAYLRAYGPATAPDLQWWTGWTAGETRRALAALDTVPVALDDAGAGWLLADDSEPVPAAAPEARLLPALDPTVMGWTGRDFYLDPTHRRPAAAGSLFDRSGNAGPTVWWGGRVVGGWAQRKDGAIAVRLLTDPGPNGRKAIDREAARLADLLADVRVTPRFRTPLERELVS